MASQNVIPDDVANVIPDDVANVIPDDVANVIPDGVAKTHSRWASPNVIPEALLSGIQALSLPIPGKLALDKWKGECHEPNRISARVVGCVAADDRV